MDYKITNKYFDIRQTFLCGQCFRWSPEGGGFTGIASGRKITVTQQGETVTLHGIKKADIPFWENYFDLSADYGEYISRLSADNTLRKACGTSYGIRILRQEPFETLISFIISQNNNIPRITGIISRLCESFGEKLRDDGHAFPTAKALSGITPDDLAPLRAGFRARYIADAVRKVNSGEVDLDGIYSLDIDDARGMLRTIVGVGDKVADCVLLFAYHKTSAFPKDVWVKRLTAEFYPDGLPECTAGIEGIAQQYLFDYVRNNGGLKEKTGIPV